MNKKNIFAASYLGVAAVWLGGHFGPGFATGAFSMVYYVKYGFVGLFMPLLAMLLTGSVIYYMTEYARSHGTTNYLPFVKSVYGEKAGTVVGVIMDIMFLATVMCAGGLAFSGEAGILQKVLGWSYWGAAIPTIIISALLCLYGSKLVARSSKYMMYAIVIVVVLIVILSLTCGDYDMAKAMEAKPLNPKEPNLVHAILSALLYGCFQSTIAFNVMSVADVLEDRSASNKAILWGYIITVFLMIAIAFALFCYVPVIPELKDPSKLPIMEVLGRLGMPWLTWLFVILMTLAVLTSTAGLANAGCARFNKLFSFIKNEQLRRAVMVILLLGIAAIGASFGLKALLQKGTSYVGYIGILVLVIPAFTIIRSKLKKE